MGLREGAVLKRYGTKDAPAEIRITKVTGLNAAEAKLSEGAKGAKVAIGNVFQVDSWVAPDEDTLRVYFPLQTPKRAEIDDVVRGLEPLRHMAGVTWIDDPTVAPAKYVLSWSGAEWILSPPGAGAPAKLGARPSSAAVAKAMRNAGSLFVLLPPAREMLESLKLGKGTENDAVKIATAAEQPAYVLLGRPSPAQTGSLEYAWALPDMSEGDIARQVAEARAKKLSQPKMPMPLRSKWVALEQNADSMGKAGAELTDLALRLVRIQGWMQLQPPPTPVDFPYHLAGRWVLEEPSRSVEAGAEPLP